MNARFHLRTYGVETGNEAETRMETRLQERPFCAGKMETKRKRVFGKPLETKPRKSPFVSKPSATRKKELAKVVISVTVSAKGET